MNKSLLDTCREGTPKYIKNKTKIKLNDNVLKIINEIYDHLSFIRDGSLLVNYTNDNHESVVIGGIINIHGMIANYLLNMNDYETFGDFLIQKKKHIEPQVEGLEDLVVDGMEERYIAETYSPKDELKVKLPKPISTTESFTCPICYDDHCYMQVICKHCKGKYCYKCCVQQARITGRCPLCNETQEFIEANC